MGRGRSGLGGGGTSAATASTPSGVTYSQFMAMTSTQQADLIDQIIDDDSIRVPSYLDDSSTSKVLYALGMTNKPTVVSDAQLDTMAGEEMFRTVYDTPSPPPYAGDITDQIRNGDFTQMSGRGGSAWGRALYFATDYYESAVYDGGPSSRMMRAKINPSANIVTDKKLTNMMKKDPRWAWQINDPDAKALFAVSRGIDGWKGNTWGKTYRMIVNRGAITVSSQDKSIHGYWNSSWKAAPNA